MRHSLLTDPIFRVRDGSGRREMLSLPEVMAALARGEVAEFEALRPHQVPAWHMFLCQLAALALHRAGMTDLPEEAGEWRRLIRGLTPEFPDDEPWHLVVEDGGRPAFMQPPEPEGGVKYTDAAPTPDALDMLITSRNHDLKQAVAHRAGLDEWIYALVSLQTGEGYNGAGRYGIARMNGGSSSRPCLSLVPLDDPRRQVCTPSDRFRWDTAKLVRDRARLLERVADLNYPSEHGLALLWTVPWPEGEQLQISELDIWFIEICRRVRLSTSADGSLIARTGTSKKARVAADMLNGVTGDAWTPVNRKEGKALTLGEGDFDYRRVCALLFGDEWELPPMLQLHGDERDRSDDWLLIMQAIARGNSKTYGYRERTLPLGGRVAAALGFGKKRVSLGRLAEEQIKDVAQFRKALGAAIALYIEAGEQRNISRETYRHADSFQHRLERHADRLFFPALWARFEAVEREDREADDAARLDFLAALFAAARSLLDEALGGLPCPAMFRHRARVRAEARFHGMIHSAFPALRERLSYRLDHLGDMNEEAAHDAA